MDSDNLFSLFIKDLRANSKPIVSTWNKNRTRHKLDYANSKKLILQELHQFDFRDPLEIIDKNYLCEKYNTILLRNELEEILDIFSPNKDERDEIEIITKIVSKCESIGRVKKIIEYYLIFVVENHFDSIMTSMKKIQFFEGGISNSLRMTKQLNQKLATVKKKSLNNNAKLLLAKQKMKNMMMIFDLVKLKIFKFYEKFNEALNLEKNNKFSAMFTKYKELKEDIEETLKLMKGGKLIVFDQFLEKTNKKLLEITNNCSKLFYSLFITIKEDKYEELFLFYYSQGDYTERLKLVLKSNLFLVIKETIFSFSDERIRSKEDIKDLNDISKLKFEDSKFIMGLNQTLANSAKIIENFWFYVGMHKKMILQNTNANSVNKKIVEYFENKEKDGGCRVYYEIVEKMFDSFLSSFANLIQGFSFRNIIYFSLYTSLFLDFVLSMFGLEHSNYLKPQIKELVRKNINSQNKKSIIKIGNLLQVETWQRLPLLDDYNFFSDVKLQENAPFFVRNLMNAFNSVSMVNSKSIKDNFYKLLEQYSYGKFNNSSTTNECKVEIFSKPLNNKSLTISSSAKNFMDSLIHLITNLVFFDDLCFEIFEQIFNLYNYYILSAILMFVEKNVFSLLFDSFNMEEYKKKPSLLSSKIEIIVDIIIFQKSSTNVIEFVNKSSKKLEVLFDVQIDILKLEDNNFYEYNEFHIPCCKINNYNNNDNNSYNSNNSNNIYSYMTETIIVYESINSMYKILKRLKHFTKKLEYKFQQTSIINTIDSYKALLKSIRLLMYKPVCSSIFKIDPILNKIANHRWDPRDDETDEMQFSEANQFVDDLYQEICEKYEKLDFLSGGSLNEKSKRRFLDIIFHYMKDKLMDSFSKIKKEHDAKRRKILQKQIGVKIQCRVIKRLNYRLGSIFGELELYINSWYCAEDDFITYIKDTNLNYKYINGIINSGPSFVNQSRQAKKDFLLKIEETYVEIIEKLKKNK